MLIVYASRTGNVKKFVDRTNLRAVNIKDIPSGIVNESFVLVTFTDGFGDIPTEVKTFLSKNHKFLVAVSASGNRNWGKNFANSANQISNYYNVPILLKFELQGTSDDIDKFRERVFRVNEVYRAKQ